MDTFYLSFFSFHFVIVVLWANSMAVTLLACTVCLRRTNTTLLCRSENGAFLLNLPSHPRTAHKHALRCPPTRKGIQDVPGEPRTTAYCAISVEIVRGHIPQAPPALR
jgi:hypothetical protein